MKPNPTLRLFLLGSTLLTTPFTVHATTYDWDGGFATNGSWAQATNWNPDGVPTFNNQADLKFNDPTMGFFRNFIAVDRTVRSLEFNNTSATAIRVILGTQDVAGDGGTSRNLTFSANSGNASILMGAASGAAVSIGLNNGGFVGSITLASNLDITNNSSTQILTIARPMSETGGARQVTKLGVGQLEFRNSTHTFTGGLLIKNGEIFMGQSSTNVINSANVVTLGDNVANTSGSLDMRTMSQNIAGLASVGSGTANRVRSSSGAATLTLSGATGTSSFNGAIQDSISLVKTGGSTQILSGPNTYSGGTTLTSGTLQFAKTNSMSATGAVAVGTGTTLAVNAGASGEFSNLTSGSGSIGGLLAGTGGQGAAVTYSGNVTLGIDTTNAGGSLTYSGILGNVGTTLGLNKLGSGTLVLDQANTYSGVTYLTNGTLRINNNTALGTTTGNTVVAPGAELFVATTALSVAEAFDIAGTGVTGAIHIGGNAAVGFTGAITLSANARIQADGGTTPTFSGGINTAGNTLTFNGSGTLSVNTAGISGSGGSVAKTTAGTLNFNAANSHTGATILNQGTISVGASGVLSGSTAALAVNNTNTGAGNASILNLSSGANTAVGSLSGAITPSGSGGPNTATINIRNSRNLTVNQTADATYQGVIAETGGTGASFTLGGGSTHALTLTGTNTYTGATTVSGGRLAIGSTGTVNNSSGISIGAGEFNYNNSTTALTQPVTFSGNTGALSGTGTITPAVTITTGNRQTAGTSVTAANSTATLGKQTFGTGITYHSGSIFEWNLTGNTESSVGTRGTDFDAVTTASLGGAGGAIFRVVLNGTQNFGESFWDSDRTWAGIFKNLGETTAYDLSTVFNGGFQYQNSTGTLSGVTTTEGAFTFINGGTDLKWTAVPEPTSALAGLLIGAGLLRRRRA